MDAPVDVLVVGAGPVGLALALQAHQHGAVVRVIERRTEADRPSRALIVHPRTLEVLRPLGVTDALMAAGDVAPAVRLHLGSRELAIRLGPFDLADTAFPHLLFIRQVEVERTLTRALADRGVEIERGAELVDVHRDGPGHRAVVRRAGGTGPCDEIGATFVAGCDGSGSTVRRLAGVGWRGASYRSQVVLADVELAGTLARGAAHVAPGRSGVVFLFDIGERATWRLLATCRPQDARPGRSVAAGELQALIDPTGLDARITGVGWSELIGIQHRIASRYRVGHLFLVGDAAHLHSPAGGMGMNTGIQDAANLGWKLAFASRAPSDGTGVDALLDSYERERRPAARRIRALTDLMFWAEAGTGLLPSFGRRLFATVGMPIVSVVFERRALLARAVRHLSQLRLDHRSSPLSVEGSPGGGGPRPGDRLPDAAVVADAGPARLHDLTATPGLHVLLHRDAADLDPMTAGPGLAIHRIATWPGTGVHIVRPDGYVGFRSGVVRPDELRRWMQLVAPVARDGPPRLTPRSR
jgi:2-polyprenyl-6-methoxyphenol hydroxylase-like FAD-dependent oxidoreductase